MNADLLEKIYKEIRQTLTERDFSHNQQLNILKSKYKAKYKDFRENHRLLFDKIINKRLENSFLQDMMLLHENKLNQTRKNNFERRYPKIYDTICNKKQTLELFRQIEIMQNDYNSSYKKLQDKKVLDTSNIKTLFKNKYSTFTEKQESLFNGMIDESLDPDILMSMIQTYKKYKNNQMSEHDASVEFGQKLVDKIVKPNLK